MEFTDRKPQYPGRIKLKNVSTGEEAMYDMTLADGDTSAAAGYTAGTPLNKATFDAFKEDILNYLANNPGPRGEKGEKGDVGVSVSNKSFLVGTNDSNGAGWYIIGSITFGQYIDYHAKIMVTRTYYGTSMPSGILDLDIRRGASSWENLSVKWETFSGSHPEYVRYAAQGSGKIVFYVYIPGQWAHYRIDVLTESNRDVYTSLFEPMTEYGGIYQNRYSTDTPSASQAVGIKNTKVVSLFGECGISDNTSYNLDVKNGSERYKYSDFKYILFRARDTTNGTNCDSSFCMVPSQLVDEVFNNENSLLAISRDGARLKLYRTSTTSFHVVSRQYNNILQIWGLNENNND